MINALSETHIREFEIHLIREEKSRATFEKYLRDVRAFAIWLRGRNIEKSAVLEYKSHLMQLYKPSSVNSVLSSLNSFFDFGGRYDCKVKSLKIQKSLFTSDEKELTKQEYERLLFAARQKKNERLYLLLQTICSTGIRVSELRYITIDAIHSGTAHIQCKGKLRKVFLSKALCKLLSRYVRKKKIISGPVFVTKTGKPLDRSNIWSDMKKLCTCAGVAENKVFPHNLRHLFARTHYSLQKDIVRLADILGHSSVNTTRIYTIETGEIHRMQLEALGLLRC